MKTHSELLGIGSPIHGFNNYMGDIISDNWVILLTQSRDSDCLERSNWDSALEILGGESDNVEIHRFGSWACGWFEHLFIKKDTAEHQKALEIESALEDYPVVNEEHFSELEYTEAGEVWQECYNERDRIEYIRENRSQFEFDGFSDLLCCVRGQYFAGYASELLY